MSKKLNYDIGEEEKTKMEQQHKKIWSIRDFTDDTGKYVKQFSTLDGSEKHFRGTIRVRMNTTAADGQVVSVGESPFDFPFEKGVKTIQEAFEHFEEVAQKEFEEFQEEQQREIAESKKKLVSGRGGIVIPFKR